MQKFTPREYLKIDIANNYGLDKKTWDERIAWFDANEAKLDELTKTADEPALFYAGVQAWKDVLAGKPIGYMISLDATSSGLQLLAALTGDRSAASLCNVVDTGKREDAYTKVYNDMLQAIGEEGKISRDDTKQAIMTSLYGSTAMPKQVFGEGALLDVFYDTMKAAAPAAWELNEAFLNMWDNEALSNDWVLPDNFHVHVKVIDQEKEVVHFLNKPYDTFHKVNRPIEQGRSLGANTIHSIDGMIVREMTRRCSFDPKKIAYLRETLEKSFGGGFTNCMTHDDKMVVLLWDHYERSGFLSARILDHLNFDNIGHVRKPVIAHLLNSLPNKPFSVVAIHDCFRCLPHYGNDLRQQYNNLLAEIAQSDMLSYIVSQILKRDIKIGKLDDELHIEIVETNYALS